MNSLSRNRITSIFKVETEVEITDGNGWISELSILIGKSMHKWEIHGIPMGGKPKTKNPNGILGMGNGKGSGPLGPIWRGLFIGL
jgi:hypothetical protein